PHRRPRVFARCEGGPSGHRKAGPRPSARASYHAARAPLASCTGCRRAAPTRQGLGPGGVFMGVWEAPPIPVVPGRGLVGAHPGEVAAAVIVSVVNPTLNEAANIGWLLERLQGAMRRAAREPALAGT